MGDLRLPQFGNLYDRNKMGELVDTLENKFANISSIFASVRRAAYQLSANTTPVGNVLTGEDDLMTYLLQPNVLAKNGYNLQIKTWGTFASNANNKTVKLKFGSSTIYDTTAIAANGGTWLLNATVTRTGTATEQAITSMISSNNLVVDSVSYIVPTESLSATITIKCTGEGTATNDVVQNGMLITLVPQE
jgi:hypothetical protein